MERHARPDSIPPAPTPATPSAPTEENTTKHDARRYKRYAPWISGATLAFTVFSLALTWVILIYGELSKPSVACNGVLVIAMASILVYGLLEVHFLQKNAPKSAFALSYFAFFALFSAASFLFIGTSDLSYVLDTSASQTRTLLLNACFRLVVLNTVALLVRIGLEVAAYIRSFSK